MKKIIGLMFSILILAGILLINTQATKVNAESSAIPADSFSSLKNAIDDAGTDHTVIKVIGSITVEETLEIKATSNITLVADDDNSKLLAGTGTTKSMILVPSGGTLTIGRDIVEKGLEINGNGNASGPLIDNRGDFFLKTGLLTGATGEPGGNGGGVFSDGTFEMTGGSISGNKADGSSWGNGGGAVFTQGTFKMTGGTMKENSALGEDSHGSPCGVGGAIFVKSGQAEILGGTITNNEAASGGGIYVYGVQNNDNAKLHIQNGLITGNTATEEGGGIWLCETGFVNFHTTMGTTLVSNTVPKESGSYKKGGDDVFSEIKYELPYILNLPERTINGDPLQWYTDTPEGRYSDNLGVEIFNGAEIADEKVYLHTVAPDKAVESARNIASVIIEDNKANNGGGIAANGIVTFGVLDEDVSFSVSKKWSGIEKTDVEMQLYRYIDKNANNVLEEEEKVNGVPIGPEVTLNDGNNWEYTWSALPAYYTDGVTWTYYIYAVSEVTDVPDSTAVYSDVTFDSDNKDFTATVTNTSKKSISGIKTWNDDDNSGQTRPDSITIVLKADGEKIREAVVTPDANGNWIYNFDDLPEYINGVLVDYTVEEKSVEGYEVEYNGNNITNTLKKVTLINISGTKTWVDGDNQEGTRPNSIKVILKADGEKVGEKTVFADENGVWTYAFDDLPELREDGQKIEYTIEEEAVPGYKPEINEYNIRNVLNVERISISGRKTWDDNENQDGARPDKITVILKADGIKVTQVQVTPDENGDWTYTFSNLPKYKGGKLVIYTVEEESVEGYETIMNGYDIVNKRNLQTINISGTKTWEDNNNEAGIRPGSIKVILKADGEPVREQIVAADENGNWSYSFNSLAEYKNGQKIQYTIDEEAVEGYENIIENYDITNRIIEVEKVEVSGAKIWEDNNNQDGIRPAKITVILKANGEDTGKRAVVSADSNWSYRFDNLPKYKDGSQIEYTVEEEAVPGYETSIEGYDITNRHIPELVTVTGIKTWEDNADQDGLRPNNIVVILKANGEDTGKRVTVSADSSGNWVYRFTDLPKYADGKLIEYTVEEEAVSGYETRIDGYNIINKHVPETIDISGTKTWIDKDNQSKLRPDSITVVLKSDGNIVAKKIVTPDSDGNWSYSFSNLPKYKKGELIVYTIEEIKVKGYESHVNGYDITNTLNPVVPKETLKPKKPGVAGKRTTKSPNTGVEDHALAYLSLLSISGILVISLVWKKKKGMER